MNGLSIFNNVKLRLLIEVVMGLIFCFLIDFTLSLRSNSSPILFFYTIFSFVVTSEGVFLFNKLINKKYPWHLMMRKRIVMLIVFIMIWGFIIRMLSRLIVPILHDVTPMTRHDLGFTLTLNLLFISVYVFLLIAFNYHESLSYFMYENECLKREKLKQDYFALQDQVNPHFLFNNLSTLIAIIQSDPKLAVRFAESFSDVYRYVLQSKEVYSITVKQEVVFIKAYLSLHKERLGNGLQVDINIPEIYNMAHIPPLSLQILVENAIKHNSATVRSPLILNIFAENDHLFVVNNLNPRNSSYSTNTGLDNLRKRYALLTDELPVITKTENEFQVELPIIKNIHENAGNCG